MSVNKLYRCASCHAEFESDRAGDPCSYCQDANVVEFDPLDDLTADFVRIAERHARFFALVLLILDPETNALREISGCLTHQRNEMLHRFKRKIAELPEPPGIASTPAKIDG